MLITIIRQHDPDISYKNIKRILGATLSYLLKGISSKELSGVILKYSNIIPIDYRRSLKHGYILKNIKLWLWFNIVNNSTLVEAHNNSPSFHVQSRDTKLYGILRISPFYSKLVSLTSKFEAYTLKQFEIDTSVVLRDTLAYTKKFAYKKLRFTTMGGGFTLDDVVGELQLFGIEGMYNQFPKIQSNLHLTNIYKNSVKNHGNNMIKQANTQKYSTLDKNADGTFSSRKVSLQSSECTEQVLSEFTKVSIDGGKTAYLEHSLVTDLIMEKVESEQMKTVLTLMTGVYNEDFSNFLNGVVGVKSTNEAFFDRALKLGKIREYINCCAKYVGLSPFIVHYQIAQLRSLGLQTENQNEEK